MLRSTPLRNMKSPNLPTPYSAVLANLAIGGKNEKNEKNDTKIAKRCIHLPVCEGGYTSSSISSTPSS